MAYVTSTMSAGINYAIYKKTAGGLSIVVKEITVNGGNGVINKNFITPEGVVTYLSDEDLELLENHPLFKTHKENGFVKVHKSEKVKIDDLQTKDLSAQKTPDDFTKKGKKPPKVNKR